MNKKPLKVRQPKGDAARDATTARDSTEDRGSTVDRDGVALYGKLEKAWGKTAAEDTLWLTYQYMDVTADLYNSVLNEAGVSDEEKPVYREMLVRYSEAALVAAMWKAITPAHMEHLREYMRGARTIDPEQNHVSMLMEFSLMYPDLRAAMFAALDAFFAQFIEDVKKMNE